MDDLIFGLQVAVATRLRQDDYPRLEELTRLGIPTPEDDVITSTFVLGRYLTQHHPDLRCYVVGEPKTRAELAGYGQPDRVRFEQRHAGAQLPHADLSA